jgi:hypothetical protein
VVAAVLAGAVVALSVVLATASSTSVLQPAGAARSFRFVTEGGRTMIVPLRPSARVQVPANRPLRTSWVEVPANGPLRTSWVEVPANGPLRTSWVEVPANAPPGSVRIVGPAGAPPGALRVQVPAVVLPAGGNARPGRWVQVPARVWVQVPARVVAPAPAASPAKSTAH